MADEQQNQQPVEHVTIKAPDFMENAVHGWFSILEAQFVLRKVTAADTKFFNAISHLPAKVVQNLPTTVCESHDYDTLKNAVISSYEKSKPEILEKLMSSTTLSGRPSLYLQQLRSLADQINVGEDIIRHKFIQVLPQSISAVIASQTSLDLQALGKLADDLFPYFNKTVNAVNDTTSQASTNQNAKNNSSSSSNNSNSNLPVGLRPFNKNQRPKVCRGHLYFGDKSKFCKEWCRWPKKDSSIKMQPSSRAPSPSPSASNFSSF